MQTPPTEFGIYQNTLSSVVGAILYIDDGADDYYYASFPITCSDAMIPGILNPGWNVKQGFNWQTKQWALSNLQIELMNVPYKKVDTSDLWMTPADELSDILLADATFYLVCGTLAAPSSSLATLLSKCLTAYTGKVISPPSYNVDTVRIEIGDLLSASDVKLPDTMVQTTGDYPYAPPENKLVKVPLVWGIFAQDYEENDWKNTGLALGVKVTAGRKPECVFADHEVHAINELMIEIDGVETDHAPIMNSRNVYTSDGNGRASAIPTDFDATVWFRLEVATDLLTTYNIDNPEKVQDDDYVSYADIKDNVTDAPGITTQRGYGYWTLPRGASILKMLQDMIGTMTARYNNLLKPTGHSSETAIMYINFGSEQIVLGSLTLLNVAADSWYSCTGIDSGDLTDPNAPVTLQIDAVDSGSSNCDGVLNNDDLLRVGQLALKVDFTHNMLYGNLYYRRRYGYGDCWAMLEGREYGSWITGRSSNYASGDCIEDPAGIIESILRDCLGMSATDIDLPSFISAENTSVQARMNLHSDNEMWATRAIRQLAEQSTFAFVWTAAGKARLIAMNDATPTTNRTIPWSHIKNISVSQSTYDDLIWEIDIKSRYLQEYNRYEDFHVQARGTGRVVHLNWPNICGDSRVHVSDHYVNATSDGIWSESHIFIEIETVRFTNADLELGDWIELDADSVDPHIQAYGSSWSGKQFLVYDLEQTEESTKIKAVELYA